MKPELRVIVGGKSVEGPDVVRLIKPLDTAVEPSPGFRLEMRLRLIGLSSKKTDRPQAA